MLLALGLGGCSVPIADLPSFGTSADAPHSTTGAYMPVNELPPDRDEAAMDPAERAKVRADLIAARDRQASAVATKDPATNSNKEQKDQKDQNQSNK